MFPRTNWGNLTSILFPRPMWNASYGWIRCIKTKEGFPMIRPVTEKDIPACGYLQMPLPKITEER